MLELLIGFLVGAVGVGGLVFNYYTNREDLTQYQLIYEVIRESIDKKDRYVTIYFGEKGIQASVYPLLEDEQVTVAEMKEEEKNV